MIDGPAGIAILEHVKKDPVSPVVNGINRENVFVKLFQLPEIEFSQPSSGFDQPGKMNNFRKMYLHDGIVIIYTINFYARSSYKKEKFVNSTVLIFNIQRAFIVQGDPKRA